MTIKADRELRQQLAQAEIEQEKDDRSSRILFSVKCLRPVDKYPYEIAVFETELSVPVSAPEETREEALAAWYKMIEGGVSVAQALSKDKP